MYLEDSVRTFLHQESRSSIILTASRELKNQRDELAQSSAVDANALADKLKYVWSSLVTTPYRLLTCPSFTARSNGLARPPQFFAIGSLQTKKKRRRETTKP